MDETIWDCGRSFHKIGVVQKFQAVMEINPQKRNRDRKKDIEIEKRGEYEHMGMPLGTFNQNFCFVLFCFHLQTVMK